MINSYSLKSIVTFLSIMACAETLIASGSADLPILRNVPWANVPIGKVIGPAGHIGIDLQLTGGYCPQHNNEPYGREPFYGANVMAPNRFESYLIVPQFYADGTNNYPHGIFIENESDNSCYNNFAAPSCASTVANNNTPRLTHDWAKKLTTVILEVYPHDEAYSGLRFEVTSFNNYANGGVYAPNLGDVTLPSYGMANIARLNGFFWKDGKPFTADQGKVNLFQEADSRFPTWKSSTGYPSMGFNAPPAINADGYYSSSPLPMGRYKIYVTMVDGTRERVIIIYTDLKTYNERADFHFEKACFGWPECETVKWTD